MVKKQGKGIKINLLERLKQGEEKLKQIINSEDEDSRRINWYFTSYDYFIGYFKKLEKISEQDLIIGIAMAYSWMPTIARVMHKKLPTEKNLTFVNRFFSGDIKNNEEIINGLKPLVSESIVGMSKFMHFLKPDKYPILDGKINQRLMNRSNIPTEKDYLNYLEYCNIIIELKEFQEIKAKIREVFSRYNLSNCSDYRIVDICLWSISKLPE